MVYTGTAKQTRLRSTLVNVVGTMCSRETGRTRTGVARNLIDTCSGIGTRIGGTLVNVELA